MSIQRQNGGAAYQEIETANGTGIALVRAGILYDENGEETFNVQHPGMVAQAIVELRSEVTFTRPDDTTQYAQGDVMAPADGEVLSFKVGLHGGRRYGGGRVVDALIKHSVNQATKADFHLWRFDEAPAGRVDNVGMLLSDDENEHVLGVIDFTANPFEGNRTAGTGGNCFYQAKAPNIDFRQLENDGSYIYGLLVLENAYTPIASEELMIVLRVQKVYDMNNIHEAYGH